MGVRSTMQCSDHAAAQPNLPRFCKVILIVPEANALPFLTPVYPPSLKALNPILTRPWRSDFGIGFFSPRPKEGVAAERILHLLLP